MTLSSSPDWNVLGFTALVSVFTGILFGLVPALQATRPELAPTLKDQAANVVGGTAVLLRKSLVTRRWRSLCCCWSARACSSRA